MNRFGSLTAEEAQKLSGPMKAQVNAMYGAIKDSIGATADRAGKLEKFQSAMSEYKNAMKVQKVIDWAKDMSVKGVLQKGAVLGAGPALKKLYDIL
jgi:hypothetical protein